jgi:hypothetical protein
VVACRPSPPLICSVLLETYHFSDNYDIISKRVLTGFIHASNRTEGIEES